MHAYMSQKGEDTHAYSNSLNSSLLMYCSRRRHPLHSQLDGGQRTYLRLGTYCFNWSLLDVVSIKVEDEGSEQDSPTLVGVDGAQPDTIDTVVVVVEDMAGHPHWRFSKGATSLGGGSVEVSRGGGRALYGCVNYFFQFSMTRII